MRGDSEPAITFRKSSYSNTEGQCVEVADLPDGGRAVRDSKHPAGEVLRFTAAAWGAFTTAVRCGELD